MSDRLKGRGTVCAPRFGPKINVKFVDNTKGAGNAQFSDLANLPRFDYKDIDFKNGLYDATGQAKRAGTIIRDQSAAIKSQGSSAIRGLTEQKFTGASAESSNFNAARMSR